MKYLTLTIISALALTACGKGDAPSSNGSPAVIPAGFSGTYKSSDGNTTLNFSGGKLRVDLKFMKSTEYSYSIEGNTVKWIFTASGVHESCEIKNSTTLFCSSAAETYTKIN